MNGGKLNTKKIRKLMNRKDERIEEKKETRTMRKFRPDAPKTAFFDTISGLKNLKNGIFSGKDLKKSDLMI